MPGTRLPGYSKINARPNESRVLEKRDHNLRSAAPSPSSAKHREATSTSGLALGSLNRQDEGNLALILIDRIVFSSS